jgi:preprotein translocase subunit SecA
MHTVWTDYTRMIFNVQVNVEGPDAPGDGGRGAFAARGNATRAGRVSYSGGHSAVGAGAIAAAAAGAQGGGDAMGAYAANGGEAEAELAPVVEQRVVDPEHQLGRNDPCWCGSGKKFKKCHGQ